MGALPAWVVMSIDVLARSAGIRSRDLSGLTNPLLVAFAYYLAAEAAFFIGTLSDTIFAPFWPPNTVLLCALLFTPPARWWIFIAAAFPAHAFAEYRIGMDTSAMLVAFVTNCLFAGASAWALQRFVGTTSIFETINKTSLYILITAVGTASIVALGGALVPILSGGNLHDYWIHWQQWYAANALGSVTLSPIAILALTNRRRPWLASMTAQQRLEALLLGILLIAICAIAFKPNILDIPRAYLPTILYSPLPFVALAAIRFGVRGASAAIVIVTMVLIWRVLNGPGPFVSGTPENTVFAMQVFLVTLSVLLLLLGAATDESRRASRLTEESEKRMALSAAAADTGIWQYRHDTDDFWLTDHCREMFGLGPGKRVTRETIVDSVYPDDRDTVANVLDDLDGDTTIEFRMPASDGNVRWYRLRASPQIGSDGDPTLVRGIVTNITERREAEAEAALQRQEIAHLMRVSMLGELSGGLAHELTQPLTAILSNAQAAKAMLRSARPAMPEVDEALDDIIAEDNRAGEVIHRLRNLLKKGESKFEDVDLNALVLSTLRLVNSELINRRIRVSTEFSIEPALTSGDAVQLQQILLNLLMNAAEAMHDTPPGRRRLKVDTTGSDAGWVELSVTDQGPGIAPSQINHLFQPFFTTKERGLGLGLVICSTIAKLHGGSIDLANNADGGLTATLRLPKDNVLGGAR
jgi:PAS domain S-box-containing protein